MQGVTVTQFKQSLIDGFGKIDESVMLWNMDEFVLSDQNEDITYKAMKIAVTDKHVLTIIADRSTYGVGYYNKKETIYIFTDNASEIKCSQISERILIWV